mgnify:CR=1 FL=1
MRLQNNLDSTWVLIGLKVCFHSATKHENGVSNMVDCLRVVRIYSTHFLFVNNNYYYNRNKTRCPWLHSLLKTSAKFVRIPEQVKTLDCF